MKPTWSPTRRSWRRSTRSSACSGRTAPSSTIALPRLQELAAVQRIILLAETWAVHAKWLRERPQDYSTPCRRKVLPGAFLSAGDYVQAQQWRGRMIDAVDDAFRDADVLLTASRMDPPFRIDDDPASRKPIPARAAAPSISPGIQRLRCKRISKTSGLPLSVQFVGRAHDEVTLLRVAAPTAGHPIAPSSPARDVSRRRATQMHPCDGMNQLSGTKNENS